MSGQNRIISGMISQAKTKGKNLAKMLASKLDNANEVDLKTCGHDMTPKKKR